MSSLTEQPTTGSGNVARMVDRLSKDITSLQLGAPKKPPKPSNNNARTAQVRFSYVAQQDDELTLEEDDVIEVIEDVEDGWARGRLKDRVGLFPTNFVSFTATPTTNTSKFLQARAIAEEIETSYSTLSRVSEEPRKKLKDETNGKTPVDRTSSSGSSNILPSSFKASVRKNGGGAAANNNGPATQNPVNKQPPKEYVKVEYEYKAAHPDELDLKVGDIVTVISTSSTDEGWYEGELNGRKGLFPENFVRPVPAASAPVMSSSGTAPPVLPAKPLKPNNFNGVKPPKENVTTTASELTIATTTQSSSSSTTTTAPVNTHKTLEERKSMVAGLQSKLFPQGKMPPHKPTFQPPANVLTSSQHSGSRNSEDPDSVPVVQMRHSVVDPTKMNAVHFEDQHDVVDSTDEPKQLESLTKFRPKQTNKRPPSAHFRTSVNAVKSTDTPPATPPLTPPAEAPTSVSVISTGPATTSFPASDSRSSAQQASPSSRAQEVQSVVKELHAVAATVNSGIVSKLTPSPTGQTTMGQKPSRNLSSGSTHSASQFYPATGASDADQGETISRAEFNEFRAEILKRLAKLEERILLLDAPMEPSERHHL